MERKLKNKLMWLAAAAVAGLVAGAVASAAGNTKEASEIVAKAYGFKVTIGGVLAEDVYSVSGLNFSVATREMTTGADVDHRVFAPGEASYGSITLKVVVRKDSEKSDSFASWFEDASKGTDVRRDVEIHILRADGVTPALRYFAFDAFPTEYGYGELGSSGTGLLMETIVLKVGRVEVA